MEGLHIYLIQVRFDVRSFFILMRSIAEYTVIIQSYMALPITARFQYSLPVPLSLQFYTRYLSPTASFVNDELVSLRG